jgi:ribosomal protein L11 methyltransferase
MHWIEITLDADGESAEVIAEILQRYGHQGVAIEQAGFDLEMWEDELPAPERLLVRAYLPADERAESAKQALEEALFQLGRLYPMPTPRYAEVDDQDWAEAWKVHYNPLRLGRKIFIRPLWIQEFGEPGDVVISLDPGMAFGTGTHPSTQLVLEAAEDLCEAYPNAQVVDLGCGSGILAIGAAKMGAKQVIAVDTDPIAVQATHNNADANGVLDQLVIAEGSLEWLQARGQQYDLALVNILAKVIILLCGQGLGQIVKPGGVAVFGGIIEEQAAEVESALRATGLEPYKRRQVTDWVVIEARKPVSE